MQEFLAFMENILPVTCITRCFTNPTRYRSKLELRSSAFAIRIPVFPSKRLGLDMPTLLVRARNENPSAIVVTIRISRIIVNTIENLRTFVTVADTGSLAAAARQMGIAPSVVTTRIDQLE